MQKIMIVSSQPDKDNPLLVEMLNVLFPECEIQVIARESKSGLGSIKGNARLDTRLGARAAVAG